MALNPKPVDAADWVILEIAGFLYRVPRRFTVEAVGERRLPYDLELTQELVEGRHYECTSLTARQRKRGKPVTLAGLRVIQIAELAQRAAWLYVQKVELVEQPAPGVVKLTMGPPDPTPMRRRKPRSRRRPGEDVDAAALFYAKAELCGAPPTQAVAKGLRIPLGTARDLIARARSSGLLKEPRYRRPAP